MFGIGDAISAGIQYLGTRETNSSNRKIAMDQMKFQKEMSNTAHQREVADLKAAGLNPALSATGGQGASTTSGSSATMENAYTDALNAILLKNQIAESKANAKKTKAETKNINEITRGTKNENDANEPELKYKKYWSNLKAEHPIIGGIVEASAPVINTMGNIANVFMKNKALKAAQAFAKTKKKG